MATQAQVQNTLTAMSKGSKRSLSLPKDKRGTGRSYSQQMFQVGRGMTPTDLTVSPVEQSAAEARSQLMDKTAVKRKAEKIYHPGEKKARKHSKKDQRRGNNSSSKTRKKGKDKRSSKKGKVSKKKSGNKTTTRKSSFFAKKT